VGVGTHGKLNGNKTADQLARQGCSHPLIGPEHAVDISAKLSRGVIRGWTSGKHEEHWQSLHLQRQAKGCLKKHSAKKSW
jgi:hypothetical protein